MTAVRNAPSTRCSHVARILILSWLAAAGPIAGASAQAARAEIQSGLEDRDARIKSILGDRDDVTGQARDELKGVINGMIDFEEMGRRALGQNWDDLSDAERADFTDVFADVVRAQSLSNLDVYRSRVTYDDIQVSGSSARVYTTTIYREVPTRVEYEMLLQDGVWSIVDIVLDDVSTVSGYSRSFQSVIRKKGFATLMDRLEKRRDREGDAEESS